MFPAYTSCTSEDSMPREYGVIETNLPTISSAGGTLPRVDTNMEADIRRRNKFRTNHFMLQRDGEILNELRIASMTITDDRGPDEEPGSTQHHTSEIDYGLSINQPVNYHASAAYTTDTAGLIDGGANGGLANRKEMRLIAYTLHPNGMSTLLVWVIITFLSCGSAPLRRRFNYRMGDGFS